MTSFINSWLWLKYDKHPNLSTFFFKPSYLVWKSVFPSPHRGIEGIYVHLPRNTKHHPPIPFKQGSPITLPTHPKHHHTYILHFNRHLRHLQRPLKRPIPPNKPTRMHKHAPRNSTNFL